MTLGLFVASGAVSKLATAAATVSILKRLITSARAPVLR